jgi:hypothetical protein
MRQFLKWRYGAALGVVTLFIVACSEATRNPVAPDASSAVPRFGETDPFNGPGACMGDDGVAANTAAGPGNALVSGLNDATKFVCEANEVFLATTSVTSATTSQGTFGANDNITCVRGEFIQVSLNAQVQQSASSQRTDIGVWIATDGGNAVTGSCVHFNLINDQNNVVDLDNDSCGDMEAQDVIAEVPLTALTVQCEPNDQNQVHVGACVGWTVPGGDRVCPFGGTDATAYRYGTLPANKTKCNCAGFDLNITVLETATLEVRKQCGYTTDPGKFNLQIDGTTEKTDATCAGPTTQTTGAQEVSAGTNQDPGANHGFGEVAGTATDLDDYTSSWTCSDGTFGTGTGGTVHVDPDDAIVCTITNTGRAKVTVKKVTNPAGGIGFSFSQNFDVTGNFSLDDGAQKVFSLDAGTAKLVTELAKAGWDLTDRGCTGVTTYSNSGAAGISVTPATGDSAVCTFTNTQRATVGVIKYENGTLPLTRAWQFQIRTGASVSGSGIVRAEGTADITTGVVTFSCVAANNTAGSPCVDVSGVANFIPGNYHFCEINMPAGWHNNINGFTPDSEIPEASDNGNECIAITLSAGGSGMPSGITAGNVAIDNTPPPGGDARTIGYWKNHSCYAPGKQADVLTPLLPLNVGIGYTDTPTNSDYVVTTCADAYYLLDKRKVNGGHQKVASDAAYGLAAQLVASILNVKSNASHACIDATIASAQVLLDRINFNGTGDYLGSKKAGTADYALAISLAHTLDLWNNNTPPCP